jgi:hypothetical protein
LKALQAVVVRWMTRQLSRTHWSAERWAREAGLAPTTVTRAMSPSYKSISSVPTLHALARAAGVPSILDYLDTQGNLSKHFPMLTIILEELLPVVGCRLDEPKLTALSHAIGTAVVTMTEQPEACKNPDMVRVIARASKSSLINHL